jgi:hypothetical protein
MAKSRQRPQVCNVHFGTGNSAVNTGLVTARYSEMYQKHKEVLRTRKSHSSFVKDVLNGRSSFAAEGSCILRLIDIPSYET